ncbi:MAG TPA: PEP-CTERM sorting domain-containing protein, partial [Lacipirellulaceae bacterium]
NAGILKANGLSGKVTQAWSDSDNPKTTVAANFDDFFSVTGTPGTDNYILTSLIEAIIPPGLDGDFNNDGKVDAADYVVWRKTDGTQPGYDEWRTNFGRTSGSGAGLDAAGVPEPSSLLLVLAACSLVACARRR